MTLTIKEVAQASGLPVIVDADTGYGDVDDAVRTIIEYDKAGAAALHIEDQVFPKRCGHLEGKELVSVEVMCEKIAAMSAARPHKDFVIIARTDARGVTSMEDAIERANAYRAVGADMIFPEGLRDEGEFAVFAEGSPGGLFANMTEFGKTAIIPLERFDAMGYSIVIFPLSMMRIAMKSVVEALAHLKEHGSVDQLLDTMHTRAELYDLLEYDPAVEWSMYTHDSE